MAGPRILSLFSGIGGLDEGVRLACPGARVLAYCEREAYAATVLLARMEEGSMESAPIWCGEVERMPLNPFVDRVDIVTAGFPCPGNSVAGKRLGTADPRWLWPHVIRIAREVRAGWIFFENPRGLLSVNDGRAFATILGDLASAGFDAEWAVLSAEAVGAAHERERVFCLARSVANARHGQFPLAWRGQEGRGGVGSTGEDVGDADGARREKAGNGCEIDAREKSKSGGGDVANPGGARLQERTGERGDEEQEFASAVGSLPLFAPGQNDPRWADLPEFLWPPAQSHFRLLVAGVPVLLGECRAHQIRCVGNSCGILQAATAFTLLARRIES